MKKVRAGVVGTGNMGANHLRIYKKLSHICDLIGIFDTDTNKCTRMQETYGVQCFDSYEALLDNVDAASIVVPTAAHYEIGKKALQKGVHILLEKPITEHVEQGVELTEAAENNGLVLQVGHIERFNPAVEILPEILKDKRVIALDFKRMSPFDPRVGDIDVVQDLMIHDSDIFRCLLPEKITYIEAVGSTPRSGGRCDYAVACMELESGVIASFAASRVTEQKIRALCITADEAYIDLDYNERKIVVVRSTHAGYSTGIVPSYRQESIIEKVYVPNHEPLTKEIESFLACVINGTRPEIGGAAGVQALEIVKRVQERMKYNRTVRGAQADKA